MTEMLLPLVDTLVHTERQSGMTRRRRRYSDQQTKEEKKLVHLVHKNKGA